MSKLIVAYGQCNTCVKLVEQVGSTEQDAALMLRHGHGSREHLFDGHISFRKVDQEEAQKIEKRKN